MKMLKDVEVLVSEDRYVRGVEGFSAGDCHRIFKSLSEGVEIAKRSSKDRRSFAGLVLGENPFDSD